MKISYALHYKCYHSLMSNFFKYRKMWNQLLIDPGWKLPILTNFLNKDFKKGWIEKNAKFVQKKDLIKIIKDKCLHLHKSIKDKLSRKHFILSIRNHVYSQILNSGNSKNKHKLWFKSIQTSFGRSVDIHTITLIFT